MIVFKVLYKYQDFQFCLALESWSPVFSIKGTPFNLKVIDTKDIDLK